MSNPVEPKYVIALILLCGLGTAVLTWAFTPPKWSFGTEVIWLGPPATGGHKGSLNSVGWFPDFELGLAADGTVVWRRVEDD